MKLELHWQILIGMLLGALIGVTVNLSLSERKASLTSGLPAGVDSASISDSSDLIEIRWTAGGKEELRVVDPTEKTAGCVLTMEDLAKESPLAAKLHALAPSYAMRRSR